MSTTKGSWPVSAYMTIVVLIVVFGVALGWVYSETRESYKAVGFNDGEILQGVKTIAKIQQSVRILKCHDITRPQVEFLTVKGDSVYLAVIDDDRVQFCRK